MATSARLNVGRLNDFRLNALVVPSDTDTDGYGDEAMAADAYLQRQNHYRSITMDYQVMTTNRGEPMVLVSPRSPEYALFIQRVVFAPAVAPATDSPVLVYGDAVPARVALRATVPSVPGTAKGMQPFVADYGPNGMSMGVGVSLLLDAHQLLSTVHIEGYQREMQTMPSGTWQQSTLPRVIGISLMPNPVPIGVTANFGFFVEYNRPLYWDSSVNVAASADPLVPNAYPALGVNLYGGPVNKLIIPGRNGVWVQGVMDTTVLVGRTYVISDAAWRQGWYALTDVETHLKVADSFNGFSLTFTI